VRYSVIVALLLASVALAGEVTLTPEQLKHLEAKRLRLERFEKQYRPPQMVDRVKADYAAAICSELHLPKGTAVVVSGTKVKWPDAPRR